jgi:hypothetical protein
MTPTPVKIAFGEMRASGVRDVLVYCCPRQRFAPIRPRAARFDRRSGPTSARSERSAASDLRRIERQKMATVSPSEHSWRKAEMPSAAAAVSTRQRKARHTGRANRSYKTPSRRPQSTGARTAESSIAYPRTNAFFRPLAVSTPTRRRAVGRSRNNDSKSARSCPSR